MIINKRFDGFQLYVKEGNDAYCQIFTDFIKNRLEIVKVFRNNRATKIILLKHEGKLFVLKVVKYKDRIVERFMKSCIKGDYQLNLMKTTHEAWDNNVRVSNDIYLLAERKFLSFVSMFVMIMEYIPGTELGKWQAVPEEFKRELSSKLLLLHSNGIVSGDLHKDNVIVTEKGLRLIDLSGKKLTKRRMAQDYIDLEKNIGGGFFKKDFYYFLEMKLKSFKERRRELKRSIRH